MQSTQILRKGQGYMARELGDDPFGSAGPVLPVQRPRLAYAIFNMIHGLGPYNGRVAANTVI